VITGAVIFVAVEGTHEEKEQADLRRERYAFLREIRRLTRDPKLAANDDEWEGRAVSEMHKFEEILYESFKHGGTPQENAIWGFWNAIFYCGTIYTTIGELQHQTAVTCGRCWTVYEHTVKSGLWSVTFTLRPTE
jgi:hypothetical protein